MLRINKSIVTVKKKTSYKTRQNHDVRKVNKEKKWNPQTLTQQGIEKTLVIGDSMVKNINEKKIERRHEGKAFAIHTVVPLYITIASEIPGEL